MSHPNISVIIPTFNRAWSLARAIDSVLSQHYTDFELIVVDDGSTDVTQKVLDGYKHRVRIITQENRGVSAARNVGIRICTGSFVAFLDSDDEWKPSKLQAQIDFFKQNPVQVICQTTEKWIREGHFVNPPKTHLKKDGYIFKESLQRCMITCSSVMMRRALLDEVGLFNELFPACEDYDLWLRIAYKYPVGLIEKDHMIRYGGHEDQLSSKFYGNDKYRIQSIEYILQSCPLSPEQRQLALDELKFKCRVYGQGCIKRGRVAEGEQVLGIMQKYRDVS